MMDYEAKLLGQIISLRNQKHTIMNHTAARQAVEQYPIEKDDVLNQANKLNLSAAYSKDESDQIRIYNGQIEALTNKLKMLGSFHFH